MNNLIVGLSVLVSVSTRASHAFTYLSTNTKSKSFLGQNRVTHVVKNNINSGIKRTFTSKPSRLFLSSSSSAKSSLSSNVTKVPESREESTARWAEFCLLISSFDEGLKKSQSAQTFLKYGLASVLAKHYLYQNVEIPLENSARFSPCAGPDIDLINLFEEGQDVIDKNDQTEGESQGCMGNLASQEDQADKLLNWLQRARAHQSQLAMEELRILYIPTASYALRSDSKNTPGKQRQRARADGKKRRNLLVSLVEHLIKDVNIMTVTLDLDDGSIKQPYSNAESKTELFFPKDGKQALTEWKPHVIYVEGGNTFWLHHCIEKGSWAKDIVSLCTDAQTPALYVGKSAGAIVAGKSVETATWKEWDDPSVVPGKEQYEDWKRHSGFNCVGDASIFPHMNADWKTLVKEKRKDLEPNADNLFCLDEWDACCVEGKHKTCFITCGEAEIE